MQLWPGIALDLLCLNSDWLWEVDAHGRMTSWTPSQDLKQGRKHLPAEGPNGEWDWRSYLRDDRRFRSGHADLLRRVKERRPVRCVRVACWLPHVRIRGWLRVSGVPYFDGQGAFLGYRGAAQNITGQVMTERKMERLDRHNQNLMTAVEASPSIVLMADLGRPDWPIIYANNSFLAMTGYTHNEVIGRPAFFLAGSHTDQAELERLRELAQARMQAAGVLQLSRRDGQDFWAAVTLVPGCQEGGRCILVVVIRDVTAERAYQQAQEQRGRLEALGRLAGGMAHEINNLLQPTQLNAEIIGGEMAPDHPHQVFIEDIKSSLSQIGFIVRNTLQFARKNEDIKSHPVAEFSPLLAARLDYLRGVLPATVLLVREGLEQTAGCVSINQTELAQVITNLTNNAVQAMHGKGTLTVRLSRCLLDGVRIPTHGLPTGSYFRLEISDTGTGMSEAVQARIFEPFFTTKAVGEGTGLGLSVVYGLVLGWGGRILVRSVPGQGATFTLYIPEVDNPRKQGEEDEQESTVGGRYGRYPPLDGAPAAAGGP